MPRLTRFGTVIAVLTASVSAAGDGHVRAMLVSDAQQLRPGATFRLGVALKPEAGWHIYWRHPGEAGLATEVDVELPDGFEVGDLQWPTPVAFSQPGGLAGYGYEDEVVLASEVTTPNQVGSSAKVAVKASWLACREVCVLGSAHLEAELPLVGDELEMSERALDVWRQALPSSIESGRFDLSVTGGPVPASGPAEIAVWLQWQHPPGVVEFFPDPGPGLKIEDVRVQTRGALTRVDLKASRLRTSDTPSASFRSLVADVDADGRRFTEEVWIEFE
jgi:DsbC/DsbD-like thiol-disulfide interchange protein